MADAYEVASRLLALLDDVDAGRALRLADIGERFGVEPACAARYRQWVAGHRSLVEERDGRAKVWRRRPEEDASPQALSRAAALEFAVRALGELEGAEHLDELRALADQHRLALAEGPRIKLERMARAFQVRASRRSRSARRPEHVRLLLRAIQERRRCGIRYERRDGTQRDYDVEPWAMLTYRGRLLLVAGKREAHRERPLRRMFDVDGMLEVICREEEARFPEPSARQMDFGTAFRDVFGLWWGAGAPEDVHLRVRGPHAVALRQAAVHPSQQLVPGDDGWWDLRLRVAVCPDLTSFVLGMLPHVQVLGPASLRSAIDEAVAEFTSVDRSDSDRVSG